MVVNARLVFPAVRKRKCVSSSAINYLHSLLTSTSLLLELEVSKNKLSSVHSIFIGTMNPLHVNFYST